jgi:hypothetical protein
MKIYHGSIQIVEKPIVVDTQRFLDFGKGFYATSHRLQAERWASIKQKRSGKTNQAVVNVYDICEDVFQSKNFQIKRFISANEEWLDFVFNNRKGNDSHDFDIVIGPVANDTLYATLSLYEANILTKDETIVRLKTHTLFDQISFHNDRVLSELKFVESCLVSL